MKFIVPVLVLASVLVWLALSLPASVLQFIGALTLVVLGVGAVVVAAIAFLAKAMAS